jgi:hypothetical protein
MKKIINSMCDTVIYAEKIGYKRIAGLDEIQQLLIIGEWLRRKHGYTMDVTEGERGSMNHKTEAFFSCSFGKRIPHPTKKGQNFYSQTSYRTFPTYHEALCFTIDRILDKITNRFVDYTETNTWRENYRRSTDSFFWKF